MLPFRIRHYEFCERCGMAYQRNLSICPHCSDLTDTELRLFTHRRDQELSDIHGLGRVFLGMAFILLIAGGGLILL